MKGSALNSLVENSAKSATQRCYQTLRQLILTGVLAPGAKLKIDALKTQLAAGTTPIREALSLLTSDQLVERLDQRGFRVATVSVEQFKEILQLRSSLEAMALEQSIQHADTAWEDETVLALHKLNRADKTQLGEFEEKHKAFHFSLLSRSPSPLLLKFCEQLYDLNIRYRYLAGKAAHYQSRDIADEHERILSAAIDGDTEKACKKLLEHYRLTGEYLVDNLTLLQV